MVAGTRCVRSYPVEAGDALFMGFAGVDQVELRFAATFVPDDGSEDGDACLVKLTRQARSGSAAPLNDIIGSGVVLSIGEGHGSEETVTGDILAEAERGSSSSSSSSLLGVDAPAVQGILWFPSSWGDAASSAAAEALTDAPPTPHAVTRPKGARCRGRLVLAFRNDAWFGTRECLLRVERFRPDAAAHAAADGDAAAEASSTPATDSHAAASTGAGEA